MGEEKAVFVFRREWVDQVKEIIDNNKSVANAGKTLRVATPLLDDKPEAYIPHFVSLGPYHHWKLDKKFAASSSAGDNYENRELKMSTADAYKVQSVAMLSQKLQIRQKSFYDMVEMIKGTLHEIKDFYDLPINEKGEFPEHFALMMAIDSSFLLCILFNQFKSSLDDGIPSILNRLEVSVMCDILKLENQIMLSVLEKTFDIAKEALDDAGQEDFSKQLQKTYKEFSPFQHFDIANNDTEAVIKKQPHLLGCLHEFVSPLLLIKVNDEDSGRTLWESARYSLEMVVVAIFTILHIRHPTNASRRDILNSYNAEQLEKCGIKIKSSSKEPYGIRFDKYSGKLQLPRITLSDMQTEVFLRNMLALEFNDTTRGDSVTRYIGLMDCLIDTPEDVRLLRASLAILSRSVTLTDEKIVSMWNGMCHPILTGHLEPPEDLNLALEEVLMRKYYMSIKKWVLWGFYWVPIKERLSKPGKGIALLVGILILVMTVIQTYCSLATYVKTY